MAKQKKCKGNGKSNGFGCSEITYIHKYGLCLKCFKNWLFNSAPGKELLKRTNVRAKKQVQQFEKREQSKLKIENKSIAVLVLEARQPYQKLIRIRDHRKGCICCDNMLPYNIGEYDAGHYFKAELYSGLIFHPDNCHGQRVYCNQHLHGNESGYNNGIIKRIGWSQYNKLVFIKDSLKSYKWDRYQLIEMKEHYKKELREVENGKSIDDVDWSIGMFFSTFCKTN